MFEKLRGNLSYHMLFMACLCLGYKFYFLLVDFTWSIQFVIIGFSWLILVLIAHLQVVLSFWEIADLFTQLDVGLSPYD